MKRSKQTTNHSRRVFLARAVSLAGLAGLAAIPGAASAQESFSPVAGRDYILIDPPQPTRVGAGKIEVLEFFNYSCPHCFRFQGPFARWRDRAAAEVEIARQPVVFSRTRGLYARLYYALESIGRGEELGDKIYEAIHRERRLLNSEGRIVDFLAENGIENAEAVFNSFTVDAKAKRSEPSELTSKYGVNSTPQVVVAGKYRLNLELSRNYDRLFETIDALVEREKRGI